MAKNDNAQAMRLYESIKKHVSEEKAEQLAANYPLSKSADYMKKMTWAENICTSLNEEFDEKTVKKIRMDCACGSEEGKIAKLRKLYQSCKDLQEFAEKATALNQGYAIEYDGDSLYLIYPQCYCSCVKRAENLLPQTWCYCTLGYTKRMFEAALDADIDVELIKSVKLGDDCCRIRVFGFRE